MTPRVRCLAPHANARGAYLCSLDRGHSGSHKAYVFHDIVAGSPVAAWDRTEGLSPDATVDEACSDIGARLMPVPTLDRELRARIKGHSQYKPPSYEEIARDTMRLRDELGKRDHEIAELHRTVGELQLKLNRAESALLKRGGR